MKHTTVEPDEEAKTVPVPEGFAQFNRCTHHCIEIPDGMTTLSCRTSDGRKVTFCFLPYKDGEPPQCVDIEHHHGNPERQRLNGDIPLNEQRVILFGPPQLNEHRNDATLVTLVIKED